MFGAGLDEMLYHDESSYPPREVSGVRTAVSLGAAHGPVAEDAVVAGRSVGLRRKPRKCIIVVLPDDHVVSPELVAERLPPAEQEMFDVIVACAGQPTNLGLLQRKVHGLQVLLAPSGTSVEELRELAIIQAPGDIVTLLSGTPRRCSDA